MVAGQQVKKELFEQLENGDALKQKLQNYDVVAVRLQQSDGTVDKSLDISGESNRSEGAWNDTTRKATISVLSILACSVIVIAAVGIYRKVSGGGDDVNDNDSIGASCGSSIVTGDHTAHQTVLSEATPTHV